MFRTAIRAAVPVLLVASAASADVTVTRGNSAPTYGTTLNFDEPGGPTGEVATNAWAALGLSSVVGGAGPAAVNDFATLLSVPGLGAGNSLAGGFGLFMNFSQPLTEMSLQYWDTSGPSGPFGGGAAVVALSGGVEVAFFHISSPTLGGNTNSWVNIIATGGATFDEVRLVGFGFSPDAFADNLSWNAVPAPGAVALLGLGGLCATRRRR